MGTRKMLLTGGSGFLGRIIREELAPSFEIKTLGRSGENNFCYDLATDVPSCNEHFDCVVHAAGKAHSIPSSREEKDLFFKVNWQGTVNLTNGLELLPKLPTSMVFISTVAVYGNDHGENIDEHNPLNGKTAYALSKIQAEEHLKVWCKKMDMPLAILRLPLIVGKNAPGNLGAMIRLIRNGLYIGIGKGAARKSMVLAVDVARFIPQVMGIGGVFNLTDSIHPPMREFENAMAAALNRKIFRLPQWFLVLPARVGDWLGSWFPLNSLRLKKLTLPLTYSDQLARSRAGWNPRHVIDHMEECV